MHCILPLYVSTIVMASGHKEDDVFTREFSPPVSPMKTDPNVTQNGLSHHVTPFLIGVAGGTASGKTSVCRKIMEQLGQTALESRMKRVVMISQDSFYKNLSTADRARADQGEFNFDHPDAFDTNFMRTTLEAVLQGRRMEIPIYDFKTHSRTKESRTVYPADVVLLEGILVLYDQDVRYMMHMKLFVDTDSDTRLARRVLRDTNERGRELEQVLNQYTEYVKPAFEEFTLPTKKYADVIIPQGAENSVAINLIVQHIKDILDGNIKDIRQRRVLRPKRIRRESDSFLVRPH